MTQATAIQTFVHGSLKASRGDPITGISDPELRELAKAGLVTLDASDDADGKAAPAPRNKMRTPPANKGGAAPTPPAPAPAS